MECLGIVNDKDIYYLNTGSQWVVKVQKGLVMIIFPL